MYMYVHACIIVTHYYSTSQAAFVHVHVAQVVECLLTNLGGHEFKSRSSLCSRHLPILFPGVETKFKGAFYEVMLCVSHVPELSRVQEEEEGLLVGAAVSLNTLKHTLSDIVKRLPG